MGEAILPHYRQRLAEIEAIIKRERLVTLPEREARIRIATDAEAAQSPAPNMRPPRLIGNTGEVGEFILPLNMPAAAGSGSAALRYDDFTYQAVSWTLTAHEARPGHEMQFAKIVEAGVSTARALFAFNSTNVEGWGLYSEWMMLPYMSPEGQLVSLQGRLLRAARAFLDPELHMGRVTPDEARRVLLEDVVHVARDDRAGSRALHVPRPGPGDVRTSTAIRSCASCAPRSSARWETSSTRATSTTSSSPRACSRRSCCARPCSRSSCGDNCQLPASSFQLLTPSSYRDSSTPAGDPRRCCRSTPRDGVRRRGCPRPATGRETASGRKRSTRRQRAADS